MRNTIRVARPACLWAACHKGSLQIKSEDFSPNTERSKTFSFRRVFRIINLLKYNVMQHNGRANFLEISEEKTQKTEMDSYSECRRMTYVLFAEVLLVEKKTEQTKMTVISPGDISLIKFHF